jgi:hypothetical protein
VAYVLGKNEEVIGYADRLGRVNGEPGRGEVTRMAERSNVGLTESASPTRRGRRGTGFRVTTLSAFNELLLSMSSEIPLFARLLCGLERQREGGLHLALEMERGGWS